MSQLQMFKNYIGIDYSGAGSAVKRNIALQVFMATGADNPVKIKTDAESNWNWNRKEIAHWCLEQLKNNDPIIIGIDHAFSFPDSYMKRYDISDWDHFLYDFHTYWPTEQDNNSVESLRENNERTGNSDELRLTENWTTSAKSVFRFDIQGAVAKSTHAGIPWLRFLRRHNDLNSKVHFWPFDGFEIPEGTSVVVEVYPAIFKRRYPSDNRSSHEHDAWATVKWLKQMDSRGVLGHYFNPPLSDKEQKQARLEGWILGVY